MQKKQLSKPIILLAFILLIVFGTLLTSFYQKHWGAKNNTSGNLKPLNGPQNGTATITTSPGQGENTEGTLIVTSDPSQIQVFIGDKEYKTPAKVALPLGTYIISGGKENYLTYTGSFTMSDNNTHTLKIKLEKDDIVPGQYSPY